MFFGHILVPVGSHGMTPSQIFFQYEFSMPIKYVFLKNSKFCAIFIFNAHFLDSVVKNPENVQKSHLHIAVFFNFVRF